MAFTHLRRAIVTGLVLALGIPGVALGAPHADTPPSVQVGWTDAATPGRAHQLADGRRRVHVLLAGAELRGWLLRAG